jgi:hypothetical protein
MALLLMSSFPATAGDSAPCKPNELKRAHSPALVGPGSRASSAGPSELQIQQRCISWEALIQPKAEFGAAAVIRPGTAALLFVPNLRPLPSVSLRVPPPPDASPTSDSSQLLTPEGTPQRFTFKLSDFPSK